jgi:hypothetical protein
MKITKNKKRMKINNKREELNELEILEKRRIITKK